jgi:hypothetical protein
LVSKNVSAFVQHNLGGALYRNLMIGCLLAFLVVLMASVPSLADTPPTSSRATITMLGQAAMVNGTQNSQLRLKITATDSSGWLLEVALNPDNLKSNNGSNPIWNISGPFTLGKTQQPIATGTATGWVGSDGVGDILLTSSVTPMSLDVSFSINPNSTVTSTANGQWPALPAGPLVTTAIPAPPVNHFFWYLSRASALLAYVLLFINLFLGIGLKARYLDRFIDRWRAMDIHQFSALLAMALIAVHIFSLLGDQYLKFKLSALFIPGASPYRPFWDALGILGFYSASVVTFSCYTRKYIGQKVWRGIHLASFGMFVMVLVHSIKSGTDTSAVWTQWLYLSTSLILVFLALWRFLGPRPEPRNGKAAQGPIADQGMR